MQCVRKETAKHLVGCQRIQDAPHSTHMTLHSFRCARKFTARTWSCVSMHEMVRLHVDALLCPLDNEFHCAAKHGVAGLPRDHPLAEVIVVL